MNGQFSFSDLLPLPPWEGLPLPRFMGAFWPWVQAQAVNEIVVESATPVFSLASAPPATASDEGTTTYDNAEEITFPDGFDDMTFMPRKIVIHRRAKVR